MVIVKYTNLRSPTLNNLTENIPTFKELEKEILTYGYNICIAITKNILEAYDRKLLAERDRKIYRHKGYRTNHIRSCLEKI